jgi:hypothetical protein
MFFSRIQLYLLVAVAFVAALFGVYVNGVQRGIDSAQRKIDKKRISNMQIAKDVEDEVTSADDSRLVDAASEWLRKDRE